MLCVAVLGFHIGLEPSLQLAQQRQQASHAGDRFDPIPGDEFDFPQLANLNSFCGSKVTKARRSELSAPGSKPVRLRTSKCLPVLPRKRTFFEFGSEKSSQKKSSLSSLDDEQQQPGGLGGRALGKRIPQKVLASGDLGLFERYFLPLSSVAATLIYIESDR
jgi:hypothetical protein